MTTETSVTMTNDDDDVENDVDNDVGDDNDGGGDGCL